MTKKQEIERVLEVFQPLLEETRALEFLWLNLQECYIVIKWQSDYDEVEILDDPERVCDLLLYEIYVDKYFEFGLHQVPGLVRMNDEQQEKTLAAMQLYLDQLPPDYLKVAVKLLNSIG